ncbi:MAG: SGNH/GDSL hydrolase family protein, partial [Candidatus Krumholzibacteriota bacterium]|nr:SGNH/GDSL hydrolase family protein [Candidatus Krumholzibacteriota bacterium]
MTSPLSFHSPGKTNSRRVRRALLAFIVATLSLAVAFVAGEIFLRVLPIPGIELQPFYYDETTGGKLYPGSSLTYRSARGERVVRRINSWGFLDVEHEVEKPPGTIRIGFFGDSYTESRQVHIDDTFFRRAERSLDSPSAPVEVIAFGVAGRSATQAWFECLNWMRRADLDYVVYVFCENDPGDHLRGISQADAAPFASLDNDSLVIDVSFREANRHKTSPLHRAAQYLKARSLLVSTIVSRLRLLRRHGIQVTADGATAGAVVMGPSSWPSD